MPETYPFREIALGAVLLVASTLLHGVGMYIVQQRFDQHWPTADEAGAKRQLVLSGLILLMLATHLLGVLIWSIAILVIGALGNMRDAFYFSLVTYTTLGYSDVMLPQTWRLLAPIMAMSGLFAFGWTTGVLVSIVGQAHAALRKMRH